MARLKVAVAYDKAFNCYFPDTLDSLELQGATIRDFSPLRDEALPPATDLVYLGCGHPEQCAEELARNHCMLTAMRNHVSQGRRVYAEGGGLAYLCQRIVIDGRRGLPMVGVLPAVAWLNPVPEPMRPVEITLSCDNWLGRASTLLRGYLNSNWQIQPTGSLVRFASAPEHRYDLVGSHQVIGSRVHLNFAAQPNVLHHFFQPHAADPSLTASD